ncbi:hypothetical protein [Sphingomonas arenae]|uniref:hypothetical protein n=1 Tax=Sphingomonas arenae TaxID=2812555 RepID=UPI001966F8EE|nr:hypothetical protein [Sphingomonas arenae]
MIAGAAARIVVEQLQGQERRVPLPAFPFLKLTMCQVRTPLQMSIEARERFLDSTTFFGKAAFRSSQAPHLVERLPDRQPSFDLGSTAICSSHAVQQAL